MNLNRKEIFEWSMWGSITGVSIFSSLFALSWLLSVDINTFVRFATTGILPLGFLSNNTLYFLIFEIIFWVILAVFGKALVSLFYGKQIKNEFWRLFIPLYVARVLTGIFLYMSYSIVFFVSQFIFITISVFAVAWIYNAFNRRYPL